MTATIFEAKTNLSELLKRAQAGEEVIITSGREKTPIARLEPILAERKTGRLGFLEMPGLELEEGHPFWDALPKGWDGISE